MLCVLKGDFHFSDAPLLSQHNRANMGHVLRSPTISLSVIRCLILKHNSIPKSNFPNINIVKLRILATSHSCRLL